MPRRVRGTELPELTPKQQRFVDEYMVDCNGTQAAIRAGYSKRTANEQAAQLLAKLSIRKAIEERRQALSQEVQADLSRTVRELIYVAYADVGMLYDNEGRMLPIQDWPECVRRAVKSIKYIPVYQETGKVRKIVKYRLEPTFFDKNAALHMLMRHQGGYDEDNQQRRPNIVDEILSKLTPKDQILLREMLKIVEETGEVPTEIGRVQSKRTTH